MSKMSWLSKKVQSAIIIMLLLSVTVSVKAEEIIKIGVLGVMSGPAASWGLVNRYCAEALAEMYNEQGGFEIGGKKYKVVIVSVDDRNDPKVAISGAERLIYQEGVKYILGPNIDPTSMAIVPTIEKGKAISIPYAFSKKLYAYPANNSILGMVASYQAAPVIYKYLKDNRNVKSVSFVARNDSESINQRDEGMAAAEQLGLKVLSADDTYETGTIDFFPVVTSVLRNTPDLLVISGVAPADAPLLIKAARELGYEGLISTETAQDAKVIEEVAGDYANGFISVGGASTPTIRSKYMEQFIDKYISIAGDWNDEAGTKTYGLEMILNTIQKAGPEAIDDIDKFIAEMDNFSMPNPFLKDERQLKYVGQKDFKQKRQIAVPMVVTEYENGEFKTLFIGEVED